MLAVVGALGSGSAPAAAQSNDVGAYLSHINALRSSVGAPPLQLDGTLNSLAHGWAQNLANRGALAHAGDLSSGVSAPWTKLGENVGMGPDTTTIFNAFVGSSSHYQNLVDPAFTHVGIGVVWVGSVQYTAHRFMAVGGGTGAIAPSDGGTGASSGGPSSSPAGGGTGAAANPGSGGGSPAGGQPMATPAAADTLDSGGTPAAPASAPVQPPPASAQRVGAIVAALRAIPS